MSLRNTPTSYGSVAKLLHWSIVVLIITQLVLGISADDLPNGLRKLELLAWHKSFGMLVLILALVRLAWRFGNPVPPPPADMPRWQQLAAVGTHRLLYALILLQPLTGWLMSSYKNFPVSFFGLFQWPDLVAPNPQMHERFEDIHEWLARLLVTVAIVHASAALYHHFGRKDQVLRRMLPFTTAVVMLSLLAGGPLLAGGVQAAAAWHTDAAGSHLFFRATQAGAEFEGQFKRFSPQIQFDPSDLTGSRFVVEIDTGSADTQDGDRDSTLTGADFFATDRWPKAHFETTGFAAKGSGKFEAKGRLTIRDVTRDVVLPFSFTPAADGKHAMLAGGTTLRRLDFGVGQGEWTDTTWVGNDVKIRFELKLDSSTAGGR
jgi:cytochrome b561/polyisoprenoid-binding protein YceI